MEVAEGKEWAKGLSQAEFIPEFTRRHPKSDFIPNVDKWIFVQYSGVKKKTPVPEKPKVIPPKSETLPNDEMISCKGCGKEFKGKPRFAHLATHKKKCKDFLNLRRE